MKIYSPPKEVGPQPEIDYTTDFRAEMEKEEKWVEKIKEFAFKHGKGPNRGKEIHFPVADGYARYVVFTGSVLIHLPVGDAWQFQYANRLTAKDVTQKVKQAKALAKLFSKES